MIGVVRPDEVHARYPAKGYARVEAISSSSRMDRGPVLSRLG